MPNPVQYNPSIVELKGGLDFVTPKISALAGSLNDCYNFEVVDRLGYKRIDGIEPFDGRTSPSRAYDGLVHLELSGLDLIGTFAAGDNVRGNQDIHLFPITGNQTFGTVTDFRPEVSGNYIVSIAVTSLTEFYRTNLNGGGLVTVGSTSNGSASILQFMSISEFIPTVPLQYSFYRDSYANLDSLVETSPAGQYFADGITSDGELRYSPVTGMKWYKERLYITQDINQYRFINGSGELKVGDTLISDDTNDELLVQSFRILSGTFEDNDARVAILGKVIQGTFTVTQDYNVYRNGTQIAGASLTRVNDIVLEAAEPSWLGSMWRSTNFSQAAFDNANLGWEEVDLGYNFSFTQGTSAGPPNRIGRTGTATVAPTTITTAGMVPQTATAQIVWSLQGGATDYVDAIDTSGDSKYTQLTTSSGQGSNPLLATNFTNLDDIPADAAISGIEVLVRGRFTSASQNTGLRFSVTLNVAGSVAKTTDVFTNTFQDFTLGGSGDMWGTNLTRADITNGFGVNIAGIKPGNANGSKWDLDYVQIKVSYQETVSRYYFFDGTNEVLATVTNFYLDDPANQDWTTNNAHGFMQVVGVEPVFGPKAGIIAGDEMWTVSQTAAPGSGSQILTVESDMDYSGVPSWSSMKAVDSRAQIIVANFFGNEAWEAMYAAYGAGRAWTYDDYYFRYIYTQASTTLDTPRHVAYHKGRLALGYRAGYIALSVAGEPESFNGVDGAVSADTGDPVVGLVRMNSDVLGIPCKESWYGLYGSTPEDFELKLLAPYEGAIEYTVVDIGRPIYTSYKGISTFDQTAAYGDFLGTRLSARITPWLLPRLSGKLPPTIAAPIEKAGYRAVAQGPAMALQNRSKNQYRLYFEDGSVLTLTLMGPEMEPVFTIHRLFDGTTSYDNNLPLVPFAWHSTVDEIGEERINISSDHPSSDYTIKNMVYSLDKGWLYRDGSSENRIYGSIVVNDQFLSSQFDFDDLRKIRVHGLSKGRFQLRACVLADYNDNFPTPATSPPQWKDMSLPRTAVMPEQGPNDFKPTTNIADFETRGRSVSIKFEENGDPGESENPIAQPPAVLQHLLLQFKSQKGDV